MTEGQAPLAPRNRPKQARSGATYAAILEAAARILEEGEGSHFTTNHIAARAGVSIGSLYQYFSCKEEILAAMIRDMRSDMLDDIAAAADLSVGLDLSDAATAVVNASVRHHLKRPRLAVALEREEVRLPLDSETGLLKLRMAGIVSSMLTSRGVPEPEQAAKDVIALSHGLAEAAMKEVQTDAEDLAKRLRRAVLGYLEKLRSDHAIARDSETRQRIV